MKYEKVIIKQIPDDENKSASGLSKYGRSRFPGCSDRLQPAPLGDGRYLTGLDPEGYEIYSIKDPELREEKRKEILELRESLKRILPNTDLSPTSTYWEKFFVQINTDQDLVLSRFNPLDVIKYHVLLANGYVAPSKDDIGNPLYKGCMYYCHVEELAEKEKVSIQKVRDRATAELVRISEDKDKMLLIGKYLDGTKYKNAMKPDTLYSSLKDYIDDRNHPENAANFLKAVKTPVEDLNFKVTVDVAIRKKIIAFKNGQYTRGGANLGKTPIDVINNLKLPEFANEFVQIYDEVNGK